MSRNKLSHHHMIPISRSGPTEDWNMKELTSELHTAWHKLFYNLVPSEICALLRSHQFQFDLDNGRYKAWCLIFGKHCPPEEAAFIVEDEWTPIYPPNWKGLR